MFMYVYRLIICSFLIFDIIASRTGEILKASVNAPCSNGYCTFYKDTDARLGFTFKLRKITTKGRIFKKENLSF